jgi:hypothetical protein
VSDQRALIEALRRPPSSRTAAITALADVSLLRAALDNYERQAIDTARAGGASWAEIAAALGLASRQAAEQRRARLGPAQNQSPNQSSNQSSNRQHSIDNLHPALRNLATLLENSPARERPGAVALAHQTLAIALDAPPGQQIDLSRLVIEDLREHAAQQPKVAAAIHRIRSLLD